MVTTPFTTLPPQEIGSEAYQSDVIACLGQGLRGLIGVRVTDREALASSIASALDSEYPRLQVGRHYTITIHHPKSRRKKRQGFIKIVIRPLPRRSKSEPGKGRCITYAPKVEAKFMQFTCTIPPTTEAPCAE